MSAPVALLPRSPEEVRRKIARAWDMRYRPTYARRLDRIPCREELPAVLNARGLTGIGVEVGVRRGTYSHLLLWNWKGEKLISIDPWLEDARDAYVDKSNVSQSKHERLYEDTKKRLAPFGPRSEIWRLTSVQAAERLEDRSIDFVYLDGAKNWTMDGLAFFLVDKLLNRDGWILFDDYSFTYDKYLKRREVLDGITIRQLGPEERAEALVEVVGAAQRGAYGSEGSSDPALNRLKAVLGDWRRSLLDLGGRNRLLNCIGWLHAGSGSTTRSVASLSSCSVSATTSM
jgi:hypothetical protein